MTDRKTLLRNLKRLHEALNPNSAARRASLAAEAPPSSRAPVVAGRGSFFSAEEAQRGAVSPLERLYPGGVAK